MSLLLRYCCVLQMSEFGKSTDDVSDSVPLPRGWQRHEGMINDYLTPFL